MKPLKIIEVSFLVLLLANLGVAGYIIFVKLGSEATQCVNSPFTYAFTQLQEENKDPLYCSCSLLSKYPSPTFHFNGNSTYFEPPPRIEPDATIPQFIIPFWNGS